MMKVSEGNTVLSSLSRQSVLYRPISLPLKMKRLKEEINVTLKPLSHECSIPYRHKWGSVRALETKGGQKGAEKLKQRCVIY